MSIKLGDWVVSLSEHNPPFCILKIKDYKDLEDLPDYITYKKLPDHLQTLLNEEIE